MIYSLVKQFEYVSNPIIIALKSIITIIKFLEIGLIGLSLTKIILSAKFYKFFYYKKRSFVINIKIVNSIK